MQVTVEDLSSVKKMLHIEIPQDEVVRELDTAYQQLKMKAKIKGFRPGKAPRSVLERLFKKDVHADVSSRLIRESFLDAIKKTDLKIVGNPQVDPPELNEKEPYTFDATVEVNPEIEDIDFKEIKLKQTNYQVSDEEVEIQVKTLQKNLAQIEPIKGERPLKADDYALIDYEGFQEGRPFTETQKTENFTLKIGSGQISKDFDDALIGMMPGENKEIKVKFPEDYPNPKLANLEIDFQATLHEIKQEVLPEIDDEMAKKLGDYQTLDELKSTITDNLKQGYTKRVEQELNEQIFKTLLAKYEFEVPQAMIEYELEAIIDETERSFAYRNMTLEQMGLSKESLSEKYRDTAESQVKRHLILNKIIEQENLILSDEELESGLKELSQNMNQPLEEIKQYYQQNKDKLEYFRHTLLEKRAIKLIMESSKIEEVEPETEPASKEKTIG
jgi:trigger factor